MANRFILNETSYHGAGAIKEVVTEVKARGLKKGLVVTRMLYVGICYIQLRHHAYLTLHK